MAFSEKDPEAVITITFDFRSLSESIDTATISVTVASGLPDDMASKILFGAAEINGGLVSQRIRKGRSGTTYALRCRAEFPSGDSDVLAGLLPVKTVQPV